ncbi:oligosaccharide flippase family protein [Bacillus sp. EAC]|uniref:oligosaccharide flippase family protein n=1 Tax=Bacillus sp. EAC TaxID=1978338 RepID=UPI000B433E2A|nr:oligosaccharide flippase family protein [Bacillus sp. EAC]
MKLNKIVVNNILQMGFIQMINYLFPLITVPYLLRTIGLSNYGIISVEISIVQILLIFSDYGFTFTATQRIAVNDKIDGKLVSVIYTYKAIMALFIAFIMVGTLFILDLNKEMIVFHIGFYFFFLSQSLIPSWLFRGINKVSYVSILTVVSKLLTLLLMFLLIVKKSDYFLLGVVYAVPTMLTCIVAQILGRKHGLNFKRINRNSIITEISEGKDIFISNIVGVLYTSLNVIVVSFFGGSYAAGIYATCEKLIGLVNSITNAVSQAVYPTVCKYIVKQESKIEQIKVSIKYFGWWNICTFIGGILILILAPLLLKIITGTQVTNTQVLTLRIMSFIPFLISLGHLFGIQTLIPLKKSKSVRNAVTVGGVINITLGMLLSWMFNAPGTATAILLCEVAVVLNEYFSIVSYVKQKEGGVKIVVD